MRVSFVIEAIKLFPVDRIDMPLKIGEGNFVGRLILTILLELLLNGIVGQVHHFIFDVLDGELFGASSNIAFFVPICLR